MPELAEVETLKRQFQNNLPGLVLSQFLIRNQVVLRAPKAAFERLIGKSIRSVLRRGKYLGFEFEQKEYMWFHFGMTGQLCWHSPKSLPQKHAHIILFFKNYSEELVFKDIRRFGHVFATSEGKQNNFPTPGFKNLGKDPFEMGENEFAIDLKKRNGRIKSLLLNQKIVAGIGNIYADESLYQAGIHPLSRPHQLSKNKLLQLLTAIRKVLGEAINQGGSSIDDYVDAYGKSGRYQHYHQVYGKQGKACPKCSAIIQRIQIAGRSSFFCSQCQII